MIYNDDLCKIKRMWNSHPLFEKVMDNIEITFDETMKILRQNANPILHDQLAYCTSMHMLDLRMITIHDEVSSGRLILAEMEVLELIRVPWLELER